MFLGRPNYAYDSPNAQRDDPVARNANEQPSAGTGPLSRGGPGAGVIVGRGLGAAILPGSRPGPGPDSPGRLADHHRNSALSASWRVGDVGLRPEFFRDAASQRQVTLTGEAFEIVLTNGERYTASALRRDGPARLRELTPDPKVARLATRIHGQQVEVSLRSADARLRVVWRAVLHDGGNYVPAGD